MKARTVKGQDDMDILKCSISSDEIHCEVWAQDSEFIPISITIKLNQQDPATVSTFDCYRN